METIKVTLSRVYEFDAEELRVELIELGRSNIQPTDIKDYAVKCAYDQIDYDMIDLLMSYEDMFTHNVEHTSSKADSITIAWAGNTWIDLTHDLNIGNADALIQHVNQYLYKVKNEQTFTRYNEFWYNKKGE